MFHRTCPVHLLFAVDEEGESLITSYLSLRDFGDVKVSFYQYTSISDDVKEASLNTGFRESTAVLKLEAHTLFTDVEDIILLDFDMVFANDVCESANNETMRMKEV
jgi:hypothetical protein